MRKILLVGKANGVLKDLMRALSKGRSVQACPPSMEQMRSMLDLVEPDLVVMSLVGASDISTGLFNSLELDYPSVPVVTVGTESERSFFLKYYGNSQFTNLARPVSSQAVSAAVDRILGDEADEAEGAGTEEAKEKAAGPGGGGKKLVLVVDDDPAMLRIVASLIREEFDVAAATSGASALTAIGRRAPDAVLLDYEMPVCDGRQTLAMIRAEPDYARLPVIFLTSMNDKEHVSSVFSLEPAGYLLKPPSRDTLLYSLKKVTKGELLY